MNMFKPTDATTVEEYLASIDEPRRGEVEQLHDLIRAELPDLEPKLWGSVIGYGSYHYKYPSGKEGDWFIIGLSNRKSYISLYVVAVKNGKYVAESYQDKLPKTKIGKSCINIKRLADVDLDVVRQLIREGAEATASS